MSQPTLSSQIEALLFVSGEPLAFSRLAVVTNQTESAVREAIESMTREYEADLTRGLALIINGDLVELATKSQTAPWVEELTKSTLQETLSRAAWEVLSIIAYRAPITRAEIEAIRGVNCNFTLRNLLLRNLIDRSGNPEDSREYIYRPSFRLMEFLGLRSQNDLPDFSSLSTDNRLTAVEQDLEPSAKE